MHTKACDCSQPQAPAVNGGWVVFTTYGAWILGQEAALAPSAGTASLLRKGRGSSLSQSPSSTPIFGSSKACGPASQKPPDSSLPLVPTGHLVRRAKRSGISPFGTLLAFSHLEDPFM